MLVTGESQVSQSVENFRRYVLIVSFTCVSFVYYCDMMWITLDRLMLIMFSVNYSSYWNERKSKYLILATWLVGLCLCLGVSIGDIFVLFDWEKMFFTFLVPTLDFSFILLASITYSFIFKKYNTTKSKFPSTKSQEQSRNIFVNKISGTTTTKKYMWFSNEEKC